MPKELINDFQGYTTHQDEITRAPSLASKLINGFSHQGDLVNFPCLENPTYTPANNFPVDINLFGFGRIGKYVTDIGIFLVLRQEDNTVRLYQLDGNEDQLINPSFVSINLSGSLINPDQRGGNYNNIVQAHRSIFFLGDYGIGMFEDEFYEERNQEEPDLTPLMPKVVLVEDDWKRSSIGVPTPYVILKHAVSGSSTITDSVRTSTGQQVAFSLFNSYKQPKLDVKAYDINGGITTPEEGDDIQGGSFSTFPINTESNIVAVNLTTPYNLSSSEDATWSNATDVNSETGIDGQGKSSERYHIYMPPGVVSPVTANKYGGVDLGMYIREEGSSTFDFVGVYSTPLQGTSAFLRQNADTPITVDGVEINLKGLYFFDAEVIWQYFNSKDLSKPVPITGELGPVVGAHDVPNPSFHMEFFKGRAHYLNLPIEGKPSNIMQVSAVTPAGVQETGAFSEYIEYNVPIGLASEQFTGCVEFLGTLVIFKEKDVYVLTDSVEIGELTKPFPGIGCVVKQPKKGYVVHKNVLYWVAENAIYRYTGGDVIPQDISELIQADLYNVRMDTCSVSVDTNYDIIYFTFDNELTFAYNNGRWSTVNRPFPQHLLDTKTAKHWHSDGSQIHLATSIDSQRWGSFYRFNEEQEIEEWRNLVWESSYVSGGDLARQTWWKDIQLVCKEGRGIYCQIIDEDNEIVCEDYFDDGIVDLGLHTRRIKVKLFSRYSTENFGEIFRDFVIFTPNERSRLITNFRISELQINHRLRGRR